MHGMERDCLEVLACLPKLHVLQVVLTLAVYLKCKPPGHVVQQIIQGACPLLHPSLSRTLNTARIRVDVVWALVPLGTLILTGIVARDNYISATIIVFAYTSSFNQVWSSNIQGEQRCSTACTIHWLIMVFMLNVLHNISNTLGNQNNSVCV